MYKANTCKSKLSTFLKFHSDFPQLSCIPSYSIVFRFLQRYSPYRIAGTRSPSLLVRNAASFILPVPYVSDFSITTARYFTDNLRVANGVHNEAEMAWCSDGPRICLHSVPFPFSFFRSPNTRLSLLPSPFLPPLGKSAIDCCWSHDRCSTNPHALSFRRLFRH